MVLVEAAVIFLSSSRCCCFMLRIICVLLVLLLQLPSENSRIVNLCLLISCCVSYESNDNITLWLWVWVSMDLHFHCRASELCIVKDGCHCMSHHTLNALFRAFL